MAEAMVAPAFREHPQRQQVVGEMHLRRFPAFALPAQAIQLVRLVDTHDRAAERAALDAATGAVTLAGDRHREWRWSPAIRVSWERHSEASTVTLTLSGAGADWRAWGEGAAAAALRWAEGLPGGVIRASHLAIVAEEAGAADLVAGAGFRASHLVSCRVAGGARIWSDFRIHDEGYGRVVIAAGGLAPADLARCVQRLQELGNYRNLALIGLPVAQEAWGALDAVERALAETGRALVGKVERDDDLLGALGTHAEALLSIARGCDYRMSATAAYARIVAERLAELGVEPVAGYQSLTDFTGRRFNPAVRTCAAVTDRLALLNSRTAQFTALLRARIETNIENQNARLLASMDSSARMQLRLQHLVEGLSVVAISYYLLGLVAYPVKAIEKLDHRLSSTLVLGAAAPVIAALIFVALRMMRRRLIYGHGQAPPEEA